MKYCPPNREWHPQGLRPRALDGDNQNLEKVAAPYLNFSDETAVRHYLPFSEVVGAPRKHHQPLRWNGGRGSHVQQITTGRRLRELTNRSGTKRLPAHPGNW